MTAEVEAPRRRLERLGAERSPARFADAERHRRRVAWLKVVLPVLAGTCVAAILISLVFSQRGGPEAPASSAPGIEMDAPVLKGVGENGKPYEVSAASARQTRDGIVELTDVKAQIALDDGSVSLTARQGRFTPETGFAAAEGGVVVLLDGGYRFETERADADLKAGRVTGNQKVRVEGPMGTIEAQGFTIEKSVKQVTFTGGVTSVLNPAAPEKDKP